MTIREIQLEKYGWRVICFIGYTGDDAVYLCHRLTGIGCRGKALQDAFSHFLRGGSDCGLTYSNQDEKVSMVAIGLTDDEGSMVNTIGHELLHVVAHICEAGSIDMLSEEPCYIMGMLCEEVYGITR